MLITDENKHTNAITAQINKYTWHEIFNNGFETNQVDMNNLRYEDIRNQHLPRNSSQALAILIILFPNAPARELVSLALSDGLPPGQSLEPYLYLIKVFVIMGHTQAVREIGEAEPHIFPALFADISNGFKQQIWYLKYACLSNRLEFLQWFLPLHFDPENALLHNSTFTRENRFLNVFAQIADLEVFAYVINYFNIADLLMLAPALLTIMSRFSNTLPTCFNREELINRCISYLNINSSNRIEIILLLCCLDKEGSYIELCPLRRDDATSLINNLHGAANAQANKPAYLRRAQTQEPEFEKFDLTDANGLVHAWRVLVSIEEHRKLLYNPIVIRSLLNIHALPVLTNPIRVSIMRILHLYAKHCTTAPQINGAFRNDYTHKYFLNLFEPYNDFQLFNRGKRVIDKKQWLPKTVMHIVGFYFSRSLPSLENKEDADNTNKITCTNQQ